VSVYWIHTVDDIILVKTVLNLRVPQKSGFLDELSRYQLIEDSSSSLASVVQFWTFA
jgi:hypothetical protein